MLEIVDDGVGGLDSAFGVDLMGEPPQVVAPSQAVNANGQAANVNQVVSPVGIEVRLLGGHFVASITKSVPAALITSCRLRQAVDELANGREGNGHALVTRDHKLFTHHILLGSRVSRL